MIAAPRDTQGGVALAIVIWFLAGMSLLVAGIISQSRMDIKLAQIHVATAKVAAAGDGGIQLMMATLVDGKLPGKGYRASSVRQFKLGDGSVAVQLVPVQGLININSAPLELLAQLFIATGIAAEGEAELLADNVIQLRTTSEGQRAVALEAVEELLRVDGFDRVAIEALQDYVVAGELEADALNPELASDAVLEIYARFNAARAEAVALQREADGRPRGEADSDDAGDRVFRADAVISQGDKIWLRRRWVRLGSSAHTRLPWHFIRTEAPRVIGAD